jgi:hypothetical protein
MPMTCQRSSNQLEPAGSAQASSKEIKTGAALLPQGRAEWNRRRQPSWNPKSERRGPELEGLFRPGFERLLDRPI